ncbi:MAG: hypothetical protein AUJ85_04445 [Elusimicrobia bacterium CG1_02_37_114]|nr:MAG: hypothetical protein AUJ85_04445 [Elusimicrobia bacterium CG1_02_37_114]PIZ13626.1 MAG: AsnC family transcriptional regulator [Elusimicrobia bacterium CG_4_10_14_0_8_um_filter_37_32]
MVSGLVLVRLQAGREKTVLAKIRDIKGVSNLSAVFGRWDLVIDIEAIDIVSLTSVVVSKIRSVPGVFSTETLITTAI